jgi:hypothetical protein
VELVHGSWTGGAPGSTVERGGTDSGRGGALPARGRWSSPVMEGEDESVKAVLGRVSLVTEEWQRSGALEAVNGGGLSSSRQRRRARRSSRERG